jgi:hypothetical protein
MGVNLLPQSNAAATSIPTSIYHSGSSDGKKYTLPQCEKWNDAIDDFKNRLLAGNLDTEVTAEDGGELLYNLQEAIRNGKVKLLPTCSEDDEMAEQLWIISNFTRLVWKNNLDLEDDYDISIALDKLPRLDAPMPTFAGFPPNSFAFLDTPGPNEAKAHEALNKLTPKIIRPASGVILCMPPDQIDTLTTGKIFHLMNSFMREKTIIVIMTKCDTIDENEFNELAVKVKEKLSPDVRPNATVIMSKTIHIRAMLKLREYLSTRKTKEDLNFEQLKQLPVWKDIETAYPQKASTNTEQRFSWPNLMSRGKLEDLYEDMVNLCHSELRNMKADDLLNTFRNLYSNAKVIALKGSLGTIIGHFADFKTNLDELEKFANASVAERKKIQQELLELQQSYEKMLATLKALPIELQNKVDTSLHKLSEELLTFAKKQTNYKAVKVEKGEESKLSSTEIPVYNSVAGQQIIIGAEVDKQGNAKGNQFDLGRDGQFQGKKICIWQIYLGSDSNDLTNCESALREKGFDVNVMKGSISSQNLKQALANSCQLWIISSNTNLLGGDHLRVIEDFFHSGRGLYLFGDNDPFYTEVNVVLRKLFNTDLRGNDMGTKTVHPTDSKGSPGFIKHLLTTGLAHLYEGVTIAHVPTTNLLIPLVTSSHSKVVTAIHDQKGKRCVVDGGFTRLFVQWDEAGSARFVKNCAVWLANYERFELGFVNGKSDPNEIIFTNGKAEIRQWFVEEVKPRIDDAVKKAIMEHLTIAYKDLTLALDLTWKVFKEMNEDNEFFLVFQMVPNLPIDIKMLAEKASDFNFQPTFVERGNICVINNIQFGKEMLQEFRNRTTQLQNDITAEIQVTLNPIFEDLEKRVNLEKDKAKTQYNQNVEFLKRKKDLHHVEELVKECTHLANEFEAQYQTCKKMLQDGGGGGGDLNDDVNDETKAMSV